MKKKLKIIKTDLFKKQVKNLPPEVKKSLDKDLGKIARNPTKAQGSMSVFGKPSAEELKQWMERIRPSTTDLVLEYLFDKKCLNKKGSILAKEFWEKYVKSKD